MSKKIKQAGPILDEFATCRQSAKFWDMHSSTDYPDSFETVPVLADLKRRHFEVDKE